MFILVLMSLCEYFFYPLSYNCDVKLIAILVLAGGISTRSRVKTKFILPYYVATRDYFQKTVVKLKKLYSKVEHVVKGTKSANIGFL